ncbi:coiled-coil domain-containing protein [Legionella spiritensis]|uniref:Coiled-coil protein n=1 Tax=Legionella spiritensis TaxID=452 RepID=A0A0W0Z6K4_LEGSP|nr:hypothetical protein [Legionella spiritensis]KTD64746.1 coiled-coil protein [Legionella spiritensis]SNV48171.1 coiled-coil protein [Legionella spiritensis]
MALDSIQLSDASKKIAETLKSSDSIRQEILAVQEMSLQKLIETLKNIELQRDNERFLLESLYVSLMKDMNRALAKNGQKKEAKKHKSGSWANKIKLLGLAIAGIVYFGCEGFDGVTALLGIFNLPALTIFLVGIGFSLLSIVVFCAFDLVEISHNLGVDFKSSRKIIDIYLEEIKSLKAIRRTIRDNYSNSQSDAEITQYLELIEILQKKHEMLNEARQQLQKSLNKPWLKAGKIATAGIAGIIFFSGGFFAGQTVALAVGGLFAAGALTPTFWPIILASVLVGLAALSVYWFVERPGIENLIGRWVGLDKEKIDTFCDKDKVAKEARKLSALQSSLEEKKQDLIEHRQTRSELQSTKEELEKVKQEKSELVKSVLCDGGFGLFRTGKEGKTPSVDHFSRLSRSQSMDDLHHGYVRSEQPSLLF